MRITDIIVEAGIIDAVKAAQKNYSQSYKKGFDSVDRVLNPKRWGDSDKNSDDNLDVTDAINRVINGQRIYDQDQQALSTAAGQIKSGKSQTKLDSDQLTAALTAAANGKPLNDQQKALLSSYLKER